MRTIILPFILLTCYSLPNAQSGYGDPTFGDQGLMVDNLGGSVDFLKTIELQDDQKIIAAGFSNTGNTRDFAVVRYLPDGSRDSTFGINGLAR